MPSQLTGDTHRSASVPPPIPSFGEHWRGYVIAIATAAGAVAATHSLRNPVFPTPLFFASIVVSTWYGGVIPGVLAVALATVALDYFFIAPTGSLTLDKPELPYLLEFALPAFLTCWFVKKRQITEMALRRSRDEMETRVHERQAELARVSRIMTIGEVGVSVSHEVNQPLMAVVLHGDAGLRWLAAHPPNLNEVRKSLDRIIEEGTRAGEIVQRIRALSTKGSTKREPVSLNELAAEVAPLLEQNLIRCQATLKLDLAPALPAVTGDRVQLQQVIFNLSMNAIEAMAGSAATPRQLVLRTRRERHGLAVCTVEDTGPGLPPGEPEQLFAAFFTTRTDGVGIGLSISRTIIEAHGGRLWATDTGHGAVFQFELPIPQETLA
ncbi:MAG: histidine kinase [Bryobacterales bacterium]|nr:histidine kinase [Bryobacterales bacterium]